MPSTHKKPKPWDEADDIDRWKVEPFKAEDNAGGTFAEESSFEVLFPKYREQYLKEAWPFVTRALAKLHIACQLDLVRGAMEVKTTRKTFDPAAILKARDLIRLLSRSVPAPQAVKILEDNMAADIIKIRNLVRNKERFAKRRQRILGPNGSTLKALELLTSSYILVQGNSVAVMSTSYKSLKEVRRVVEDAMRNVHPIYKIKELMIKRELARDPKLATESWDRFLPQIRRKNVPRREPFKVADKSKKNYTPFPPAPEKSKVDMQIESGEYFIEKEKKRALQERLQERQQRQGERQRQKEKGGA